MLHSTDLGAIYAEHLNGQIAQTTRKVEEAKAHLDRLETLAAQTPVIDLEQTIFRVSIASIYDGTSRWATTPAREHPKVTERGLARAIKAAEGPNVRTDKVLTYKVWAMLPGIDLPIPDEIWMPFSAQTPETVRA